jgi:hypothetical protein
MLNNLFKKSAKVLDMVAGLHYSNSIPNRKQEREMENNDIIENEHLNQPFHDFAPEDNRTGAQKVLDAFYEDAREFNADISAVITDEVELGDAMHLLVLLAKYEDLPDSSDPHSARCREVAMQSLGRWLYRVMSKYGDKYLSNPEAA